MLIFEAAAPSNGTSQPNPAVTRRAEPIEEMISLVEQALRLSPRELVDRAGWGLVRELLDRGHDPAPSRRSLVIAGKRQFVNANSALLKCVVTIALEHGCAARQTSISGITVGS